MRQLIINADDFGLTEKVSQGILHAHHEGILTSTTLMATGKAFDAAVSMGRQASALGIGVHLNLTEGVPVSRARNIPSLVNRRGRLYLNPGRLLLGIVTRQVNLGDVEIELRQQISKVFGNGILPTHLDGHKHVHVLPEISDIVIRLAREFSIGSVRCPWEAAPQLPALLRRGNSGAAVVKQYLLGRTVSVFARRFKEKLSKSGLLSPAHFYGLSQTGFLDGSSIQYVLEHSPEGVSELMCHPGYLDADLAKTGTRLLAQREVELRGLTAPQTRDRVAERGIQLINYRQLEAYAPEREVAGRAIKFESALVRRGQLQQGGSAQ